jgi:hypothetical protein
MHAGAHTSKNVFKGHFFALRICLGALVASIAVAQAADSCNWNKQPNGSYFGICVNNAGTMYCVSCPSQDSTSRACVAVSCK